MKIKLALLCSYALLSACNNDELDPRVIDLEKPTAQAKLTLANAPVMDGSDSTEPLRTMLMCHSLGIEYDWEYFFTTRWGVWWKQTTIEETRRLMDILANNNTHGSFMALIDGKSDIIITARGISRDEQKYAKEQGVDLLSRPIAKDAFSFIVNTDNPIKGLTTEQVRKIYMGEITNWKDVGGNDAPITAYVRNANSGSQEKMETVVMAGLTMPQWKELVLWQMISPYTTLEDDINGLCYTPYYYYKYIVRPDRVKTIAIDDVMPDKRTISNNSYPFVTKVMVSIRANTNKSSTAYQLFYQLCSGQLNSIINKSGYVTY